MLQKLGYSDEQINALLTIAFAVLVLVGIAVALVVWYVDSTTIHHAQQCLVGCLQEAHALER